MNVVVAFGIEVSKLAVMAIILFFVCEALAMPPIPKRVCQMLIILIAILAAIQLATAGSSTSATRRDMSLGGIPSIIAPERR